jgi:hypothetical protein
MSDTDECNESTCANLFSVSAPEMSARCLSRLLHPIEPPISFLYGLLSGEAGPTQNSWLL